MAGASILASLSSLRQDLSRLKSTAQSNGKALQGAELPPLPIVHDSMEVDLDGLEVNSTTDAESDKAADIGATSKMLSLDANLDSGLEAGNVMHLVLNFFADLEAFIFCDLVFSKKFL